MIDDIIYRIRASLKETFTELFEWFSVGEKILIYQPVSGGWSIAEIVVHIALTNHYLLILIRKGYLKAIDKSDKINYKELLRDYHFEWEKIETVGKHRSFEWHRPAHMKPQNNVELSEIKNELQLQLDECLDYLDKMKNGEGVLHKTMMSVNNIGKIDVYHYIYFLSQHARRHIAQIEEIKKELDS